MKDKTDGKKSSDMTHQDLHNEKKDIS